MLLVSLRSLSYIVGVMKQGSLVQVAYKNFLLIACSHYDYLQGKATMKKHLAHISF